MHIRSIARHMPALASRSGEFLTVFRASHDAASIRGRQILKHGVGGGVGGRCERERLGVGPLGSNRRSGKVALAVGSDPLDMMMQLGPKDPCVIEQALLSFQTNTHIVEWATHNDPRGSCATIGYPAFDANPK